MKYRNGYLRDDKRGRYFTFDRHYYLNYKQEYNDYSDEEFYICFELMKIENRNYYSTLGFYGNSSMYQDKCRYIREHLAENGFLRS